MAWRGVVPPPPPPASPRGTERRNGYSRDIPRVAADATQRSKNLTWTYYRLEKNLTANRPKVRYISVKTELQHCLFDYTATTYYRCPCRTQ